MGAAKAPAAKIPSLLVRPGAKGSLRQKPKRSTATPTASASPALVRDGRSPTLSTTRSNSSWLAWPVSLT